MFVQYTLTISDGCKLVIGLVGAEGRGAASHGAARRVSVSHTLLTHRRSEAHEVNAGVDVALTAPVAYVACFAAVRNHTECLARRTFVRAIADGCRDHHFLARKVPRRGHGNLLIAVSSRVCVIYAKKHVCGGGVEVRSEAPGTWKCAAINPGWHSMGSRREGGSLHGLLVHHRARRVRAYNGEC